MTSPIEQEAQPQASTVSAKPGLSVSIFRVIGALIYWPLSLLLLTLLLWNMFEHGQPLADISLVEIIFFVSLFKLRRRYVAACKQHAMGWLARSHRLAMRMAVAALLAIPALLMSLTGRDLPFLDLLPLGLVLLTLYLATPRVTAAESSAKVPVIEGGAA